MVICSDRGADLHMAQLMPLPLAVSCSSEIQIGFTFLVLAHPVVPEKGPSNGCVWGERKMTTRSNLSSIESSFLVLSVFIGRVCMCSSAAFYNCGEPGHIQRDCPNPGVSSADSRACYSCGETGHLARDCPDQQVDDRECYNCGAIGHISRDCPEGGGGGEAAAASSYNDSTACYKSVDVSL